MDFLRKKNPKVSLHQYRVFSTVKEKSEWGETQPRRFVGIGNPESL
jgi:hypothetical protein